MKKLVFVALVILLGTNCSPLFYDVTVEVIGDDGVQFECWYATTWYGADSVYGTTPHTFDIKMRRKLGAVAVSIYREYSPGLLWAKLVVDGAVKDEDSTSANPGGISLGWDTTQ